MSVVSFHFTGGDVLPAIAVPAALRLLPASVLVDEYRFCDPEFPRLAIELVVHEGHLQVLALGPGGIWPGFQEKLLYPGVDGVVILIPFQTLLVHIMKRAVVVGRSDIVGKPAAFLLLHENATVTVCHSRTEDLAAVAREADILVAAIGRPAFVTRDFIKPGATVLDVGINRLTDTVEAVIAVLRDSQNYVEAVGRGIGVYELPHYKAKHDIEQLAKIVAWLERRPVHADQSVEMPVSTQVGRPLPRHMH